MKKRLSVKNNSGSITVEAAVIVPTVILAVIALIYMSLLWFHHAYIRSVANNVAKRGAEVWDNAAKSIQTGKIKKHELGQNALYWRLADLRKAEKLEMLSEYTKDELDRCKLLKPISVNVDTYVKDYIVYKKLGVVIENSYVIPGAKCLKMFGVNDIYLIKVRSEAVIDDCGEFVRNTDFIIDMERELENKYPGLKNLAEKTRNVLNEVNTKLNELASMKR